MKNLSKIKNTPFVLPRPQNMGLLANLLKQAEVDKADRKKRDIPEINLMDYMSLLNPNMVGSRSYKSNISMSMAMKVGAPIVFEPDHYEYYLDNTDGIIRFITPPPINSTITISSDYIPKNSKCIDSIFYIDRDKADWIKKANTVKPTQMKNEAQPSKLIMTILKGRK